VSDKFRAAPRWDGRPTSILSRHRSDHQRITNFEGKDFRIDYTGLQAGETEEKKSVGDYVERYEQTDRGIGSDREVTS
jgi:hypothetical protein